MCACSGWCGPRPATQSSRASARSSTACRWSSGPPRPRSRTDTAGGHDASTNRGLDRAVDTKPRGTTMADELVFYTHPMSRGRIVRWMLEEVGEPYRTELLDYA